ncbi:MAG: Mrp/NBP35 family ATP-binding protein [Planctomycetia bacterium]|nr:Mrp/NBP35 family ATP-binding protein [Planctomycetia bacterium]
MSQSCSHQCDSCDQNCSERKASLKAELNELSSVKKVYAVASGKGGVGKSLVTALLASQSQKMGRQTAILDADITGPSVPKMFGVARHAQACDQGIFPEKTNSGIQIISVNLLLEDPSDPVIWRGPVIAGVIKQFWSNVIWNDVDVMFVDMPPGTGDVPLTVFQSLPIDGVIIVATPQELVSMIVGKAIKMAEMMNIPIIGLVENMSYVECPDCGRQISLFGERRLEEYAAAHGLPLLARIPINPTLADACDKGEIETFSTQFFDANLL